MIKTISIDVQQIFQVADHTKCGILTSKEKGEPDGIYF